MRQAYKRQIVIGIGVLIVLVMMIATGVISSSHQMSQQTSTLTKQESAYANILKDSLSVYYSRYATYPDTYQALLDDINKSRDIYGVNDEGMSELTNINVRLHNFAYLLVQRNSYKFTYDKASGSKMTVRSE